MRKKINYAEKMTEKKVTIHLYANFMPTMKFLKGYRNKVNYSVVFYGAICYFGGHVRLTFFSLSVKISGKKSILMFIVIIIVDMHICISHRNASRW